MTSWLRSAHPRCVLRSPKISDPLSRRDLLKQAALLGGVGLAPLLRATETRAPFSDEDDKFLDELEQANYLYFWEQASPQTGLVRDRSNVRGNDRTTVASIAATGFGLTALCIAEKRGYISHAQARRTACWPRCGLYGKSCRTIEVFSITSRT